MLSLLLFNLAFAGGHAAPEHAPSDHHHTEPRHLFGIKLVEMVAVHPAVRDHAAEVHGCTGGGPFYEHTVVPGWLDLEVAAQWLQGEDFAVVPLEFIAKKPFHLSRALTAYVGGGAALDVLVSPHKPTTTAPAAMGVVGGYAWFGEHVGLDLEVDYARVFGPVPGHEWVFAAGPVVHW